MEERMKRLSKFLLITAALPAWIPSAFAVPGDAYFGASGDLTWLSRTNTGGGGNAALGWRLWPNDMGAFRLEGEVGYHGAPNEDGIPGHTHYFTYMGNVYYD